MFALRIKTNLTNKVIADMMNCFAPDELDKVFGRMTDAHAKEVLKVYKRAHYGHGDRRGITRRAARVMRARRGKSSAIIWDDYDAAPVGVLNFRGRRTRGFIERMVAEAQNAGETAAHNVGVRELKRAGAKARRRVASAQRVRITKAA